MLVGLAGREVGGVGEVLEVLLADNGVDFLGPLAGVARHVVVEAFLLMPGELRLGLATSAAPDLVVAAAEFHLLAVDGQDGRHLMGELFDGLAVLVQGLDVELLAVECVLAEQEPDKGVHDRCLSASVATADGGHVVVEVDFKVADAFEIQEAQFD